MFVPVNVEKKRQNVGRSRSLAQSGPGEGVPVRILRERRDKVGVEKRKQGFSRMIGISTGLAQQLESHSSVCPSFHAKFPAVHLLASVAYLFIFALPSTCTDATA